ncbi:hypothetical protein HMPREF9441_02956 [Paraprevotella clara YIT 11840]|uniref:Uncharacterized protein n=1 Tax=Paraprevotella clara YIT 11840 TaxID=762968 RepID=G5SUA0_9BACT|nr:hypothetical protein HMPREF9441_02956 [Paraprevotella clara YIT 11840]
MYIEEGNGYHIVKRDVLLSLGLFSESVRCRPHVLSYSSRESPLNFYRTIL